MRTLSTQEISAVSGGALSWSEFTNSADGLGLPPILRPLYFLAYLFAKAIGG